MNEEFKSQKDSIVQEKRDLEARIGTTGERIENWMDNRDKALKSLPSKPVTLLPPAL